MTRKFLLLCISLCTIILTCISALTVPWFFAPIILVFGIGWLLLEWHACGKAATSGMISATIFSAALAIHGFTPLPLVFVVILAISAWDLSGFCQRLKYACQEDVHRSIERIHLKRLLLVNITGLLIAVMAIFIQLRIDFYVLLVIGVLTLLMLFLMMRLVTRFRKALD